MILVSCNLSQNGFKNFGTDTVYYLHHINCISKLHVPYLLSPWRPGVGGDSRHTHMYAHLPPIPALDGCFIHHGLCSITQGTMSKVCS